VHLKFVSTFGLESRLRIVSKYTVYVYTVKMASLKEIELTILCLQQTYIDDVFKIVTLKSWLSAGLLFENAGPNFTTRHL